jgi:predicted metal-dependent peptidase
VEPIELPPMLSGGEDKLHARIQMVTREVRPDVLVYFTNAEGEFPAAPPPYPVIWLVRAGHRSPG